MHDWVGTYYAKKHNGRVDPEARLIIVYPAVVLLIAGLALLGVGVQNHWASIDLAVFAAIQVIGTMILTVAVNACLLDSYPEMSGSVSAWLSAGRILGGFMATYIQIPWVSKDGPARTLGAQAGVTGAATILIIVVQVFGKRLRRGKA